MLVLFISLQLTSAPLTPPPPPKEMPEKHFGLPGREVEITDEAEAVGTVLPFALIPDDLRVTLETVKPKADKPSKHQRLAKLQSKMMGKFRFNRRGLRNH